MKVDIITCFDPYDTRISFVENFFNQKGYDVKTYTSDFVHAKKERREVLQEGRNVELIHVPAYKRNLSPARLFSHFMFSIRAYKKINEGKKPDIIYALVPPNFLCGILTKYKRRHPNTRLIFDIYDMWPESMTRGKHSKFLSIPFGLWAALRNRYLRCADFVFTECVLYRKKLAGFLPARKTDVLYITKKKTGIMLDDQALSENELHLCYLGSINNLIDIELISALVSKLTPKKSVCVHIIGEGEKRDEFIAALENVGAIVQFYGAIYDDNKKAEIFSKCHFGLNIMKAGVCVGLTQKSVDYFEAGLPVINNIPCDTAHFVDKWKCGVNMAEDVDATAEDILSFTKEDILQMRRNTKKMFSGVLSEEKVFSRLGRAEPEPGGAGGSRGSDPGKSGYDKSCDIKAKGVMVNGKDTSAVWHGSV